LGRQTKLTEEVQEQICRAVEAGTPLKHAAAFAGIGETTVYQWMARGEESDNGSVYRSFQESVTRAQARSITRLTARIMEAAQQDWRAAAWLLTRRAPEDFVSPERRGDVVKSSSEGEVARLEATRKIRYLEARAARKVGSGKR